MVTSDEEQPEHEMDEVSAIKPMWITYRQAQIITGLSRGMLSKIASAGLVPRSKHDTREFVQQTPEGPTS